MNNEFYNNFDDKKQKSSKSSTILVPFISGALGAGLVVSVIFGVTPIKEKLISNHPIAVPSIETSATSQISLSQYSDTSIYAANKVLPSIVGIEVNFTVDSIFFKGQTQTAKGSGIIISDDGYILTNNHIISSADSSSFYEVSKANSVKVSLYNDKTKYDAKIIGLDQQTDLAVIKIDKKDLTPAELGNSDSLSIGEFVLAIGSPLGLESSVTAGIVSALNRNIDSPDGSNYVVIQTDCAINAGNSGGALVNSDGKVIGINTLKFAGNGIEGMGFAIPINRTTKIVADLIKNGKVLRPFIGIAGKDLSKEEAEHYNLPLGIYIQDVEIKSSAEASGLKVGDVITAIDKTEIKTMKELNDIKNQKSIGDTIVLTVFRDGKSIDVSLKLKEKP